MTSAVPAPRGVPSADELISVILAASAQFAGSVERDIRGGARADAVQPRTELEAESLALAIHFVDRWAESTLGPDERERAMAGIQGAMAERLAVASELLRHEFARAQKSYGRFAKAAADEGGISKDTLCWEVAKQVSSEFAPENPVRVAAFSVSAVQALSFVQRRCDELSGR